MTTLTREKLPIEAAELNGESTLPMLITAGPVDLSKQQSDLDESDEIFLGFGGEHHCGFPYRSQDCYTRELTRKSLEGIVLENEHLRAEFIPELGGRLWSLYDKDNDKDLLFNNPVFRPSNLAIRNAWFSGGVEWNCAGLIGHNPHTCSPMFTAVLSLEDGTPVLRMYTYERIRCVTYQMDFWLPEESKLLYCRMRVVNPFPRTTAMYWWSNMAVPNRKNARVVVPADSTYTMIDGRASKVNVPYRDGLDITYPDNNPIAVDYFWNVKNAPRKYICHLGEDGYGMFQTSTSRLRGRKLFVWGQGTGGERWQEYLSGKGCNGKYCEIQAGIGSTQYEMIPMPPRTAWEWIEVYGSMKADPKKIHGEWKDARAEAEEKINAAVEADYLERLLEDTREMALTPADTLWVEGNGWGALENARRAKVGEAPMSPHLDFGKLGYEQEQWISLLEDGKIGEINPSDVPASWMSQYEWVKLLEKSVHGEDKDSWYAHLHLGCAYLSESNMPLARREIERAVELDRNGWTLYALAEFKRSVGDLKGCASLMIEASGKLPDNISMAKMTARYLDAAHMYSELLEFAEKLSPQFQNSPRIRLYRAFAAAKTGDIELADELLYADGGLILPDVQEAETCLSELWYLVEEGKASREGRSFDREKAKPPKMFDFRMFVVE